MPIEVVLARFGLGDPPWLDPVTAVVIALIAVFVSFLFHKMLMPVGRRIARKTSTDLDNQIIQAFNWPVTIGLLLLGIYLALVIPLDLTEFQRALVDQIARALGTITGIALAVGLVSRVVDWYLTNMADRTNFIDDRFHPLLRRVAVAIVYALGFLIVLDVLNINISPLIAGLGLGGLAVALAIQPTLANLFAGTYVMTEGVISTGDYIELEGGIAGYVVEVSWRSTRIRTWGNNLVVIPNAKLADTIFTNYQEPTPAVNVYLTCGVSYDSDLAQVEVISREVMQDLLENDTNGVREYGGWFGFESFGDSNVTFWLFVQARDRLASFELQSALIRDVQQRFAEEGIVINYPVRTLQFPDWMTPEDVVRQGPGASVKRPSAGPSSAPRARPARPSRPPPAARATGGDPDGPDIDAPG